jgi:hypothetical protein
MSGAASAATSGQTETWSFSLQPSTASQEAWVVDLGANRRAPLGIGPRDWIETPGGADAGPDKITPKISFMHPSFCRCGVAVKRHLAPLAILLCLDAAAGVHRHDCGSWCLIYRVSWDRKACSKFEALSDVMEIASLH